MQSTKIWTDESMMELASHGTKGFPFQYYYEDVGKFDNRCIDWHWHREFELVSVTKGIVQCSIGNISHILEDGDGLFINSGVIHRYASAGSAAIPNLVFSPEFMAPEGSLIHEKYVSPFLSSGISHVVLKAFIPWQKNILNHLHLINNICEEKGPAWELKAFTLICQIWEELYGHRNELVTMDNAGTNRISQSRFRRMTMFIEENYRRRLTLDDIASSVGVSKREALRCFQCSVPLSPIEYLNKYRLKQASNLLLYTSRSITEIAEITGFESTSYFDRLFKREFRTTPRKHRNALKIQTKNMTDS